MTFGREAPESDSVEMLDRYLDAGGNFLDTANVYGAGASEEILGRVFAARPGLRDSLVLATKFRMPTSESRNDMGGSRRHIRSAVEQSLQRLQTDWIDLYQMHAWDPHTPLEETLSTLDDLVHEGKVRYIGASNYAGWQLATALGTAALHNWTPFVSLQPQYSLVSRDIERELLPLCGYAGLAVLPWSPLGGGMLTGKYRKGEDPPADSRAGDTSPSAYLTRKRLHDRNHEIADTVGKVAAELGKTPAQIALNWVVTRPGVTSTILGARTLTQLDDNLGALGWELDEEHERVLEDASALEMGYPYEFINMVLRR
jgi:aryl-alcohol dehydrogenase-like predicted oxidoreductase